jgi:hypothetical protein
MTVRHRAAALFASTLLLTGTAYAQNVSVTRGILEDQPFTLIYPETMLASGGADDPLTINHPEAPLQCDLVVVPVEDTTWTPQAALGEMDDDALVAEWSETFPGFSVASKSIVETQAGPALTYTGTSQSSAMDIPITLVHTEIVDGDRGYVLDCIYATSVAANAAPIVDFIVANFSTRSDADCCIGAEPVVDVPLAAE